MSDIDAIVYALAVHAPHRPHAVIGVLGDGSTGVLRLQFTEPTTWAEVAHVVDVVSDYVPLPLYVETVWTERSPNGTLYEVVVGPGGVAGRMPIHDAIDREETMTNRRVADIDRSNDSEVGRMTTSAAESQQRAESRAAERKASAEGLRAAMRRLTESVRTELNELDDDEYTDAVNRSFMLNRIHGEVVCDFIAKCFGRQAGPSPEQSEVLDTLVAIISPGTRAYRAESLLTKVQIVRRAHMLVEEAATTIKSAVYPAGVAFGLLGDLASLLDADRIYDALLSAQRAPAPAPDEMEVEIPEVVEVTRLLQRCTTAAFKTGDAHAPIGVLAHICLRFSLLGPWPTGNLKDVTTNLSSALSRGKNERRPKSKSTKSKKKAVRRSGSPKR